MKAAVSDIPPNLAYFEGEEEVGEMQAVVEEMMSEEEVVVEIL